MRNRLALTYLHSKEIAMTTFTKNDRVICSKSGKEYEVIHVWDDARNKMNVQPINAKTGKAWQAQQCRPVGDFTKKS
jgi:hypothetical protein